MWKGVGDWTKLQHIDPHSIGHNRVFSPFSWATQPEAWGPSSPLGTGFLYHILSKLVWCPKLTDFLSSLSYIIVQSPTQYLPITGHRNMHFHRLWNGMFDRHQAEITVMQFTGHSLPVHQFVTVLWDFNPVPYSRPRQWNMHFRRLWNGMFGGVGGQYTTRADRAL